MGPTWGRQIPGGPDIGPIDLPIRVKFLPSFYWACVYLPTVWLKLTRISESGPRCLLRLPLNTLRPGQNGHHFSDDIFKSIFLNENVWISVEIMLKFVHLTILQRWFRKWLGAHQATSHCMNQWLLLYGRIYASLGFNELTLSST